MNRAPRSWLLPTAAVAYVALGTLSQDGTWLSRLILVVPAALAFGLRMLAKWVEAGRIFSSPGGVRAAMTGLSFYLAALPAGPDDAGLRAALSLGLGLLVCGALFCVARAPSPPGLLRGNPAASSLDALFLSGLLWTVCAIAFLTRVLAPDVFQLDPWALDTLTLFSSLGSLLLLCAAVLRVRLLRGLELGVADRANAALALAIAGTVVAAGSGLVALSTADRLATMATAMTAAGIVVTQSAPSSERVARGVRGLLVLLLLGAPGSLLAAWSTSQMPQAAVEIALVTAFGGMLVGLVARAATKPLAKEGSRWLDALTKAMDAALHPEPDMALRAALLELRRVEPKSKARPEIFRVDPSRLLAVDIAGYLEERSVDFPRNILEFALREPARTLRRESLSFAQVRKPEVRPLLTWFEAHHAKTATALTDDDGPVGLLVLPRGTRTSFLSMEEVTLINRLAERLAGLISVTGALGRSRAREQGYQKQAEAAEQTAQTLREELERQKRNDLAEARNRAEGLLASAHSLGAQLKFQQLESFAEAPLLRLSAPPGVDPIPWAAHLHLLRDESPRPLVVVDLAQGSATNEEFWEALDGKARQSEASPLRRAEGGTLVFHHPSALPEALQERLVDVLEDFHLGQVIVCSSLAPTLSPRLARLLSHPEVVLPSLDERPEDLQAFIIAELARLGMSQKGTPLGIERAALYELVQRDFAGNELELRGLLAAAAARTEGERVTLGDLRSVIGTAGSSLQEHSEPASDQPKQRRTRMRPAPRARRH